MERPGYERFALVSNPFHDLASESLEHIEVFHVGQESDEAFESIKQEVLERQRKAFVFLVGPLGAGKSHRLRITEAQARRVGANAALVSFSASSQDPLGAIAQALVASAGKGKGFLGGSTPKWAKGLSALRPGTGAEGAGAILGDALNAAAPAFLLLNDIDHLPAPAEARLLQGLLAAVSRLQPGVCIAAVCQAGHYGQLTSRAPALASRVNRVFQLAPLDAEEARLILAKRLAGRRLIDDLDPLYPFSDEAVDTINARAQGSPRRLLQLADVVLDHAVRQRAYQVDADLAEAALAKGGPLVEATPALGRASLARPVTASQVSAPTSLPAAPARNGAVLAVKTGQPMPPAKTARSASPPAAKPSAAKPVAQPVKPASAPVRAKSP